MKDGREGKGLYRKRERSEQRKETTRETINCVQSKLGVYI